MKRIAVIGGLGRMGRRYAAILRRNFPFSVVQLDIKDPTMPFPESIDACIVATPTASHYSDIELVCKSWPGVPLLCEKPVTKYWKQLEYTQAMCEEFDVDFRMVCNWSFVVSDAVRLLPKSNSVRYSNWISGEDGLFWDAIQLIYLDRSMPELSDKGDRFECQINNLSVSLGDIDLSYIRMIKQWIKDPTSLWGIAEAQEATYKVEGLIT